MVSLNKEFSQNFYKLSERFIGTLWTIFGNSSINLKLSLKKKLEKNLFKKHETWLRYLIKPLFNMHDDLIY